jgi:hypothetical protein
MGGTAPAEQGGGGKRVVYLGKNGKIPARYLPPAKSARNAKLLDGADREKLSVSCPIPNAIGLGTWCLESGQPPALTQAWVA